MLKPFYRSCLNMAEFNLKSNWVQGKSLAITAAEIILTLLNRNPEFPFYKGLTSKSFGVSERKRRWRKKIPICRK